MIMSIWHHKGRNVLILLLTTLTCFLVLLTLTNSLAFYTQLDDVRALFRDDLAHTYRVDAVHIENEDRIGEDFAALKGFVNEQEDGVCGAYDLMNVCFEEREEPVRVIFVDPEILEIVDTDLAEEDFAPIRSGKHILLPLYAGKDFEDVLKVGDQLTMERGGERYVVAGFLDDSKWLNDNDPVTMPQVSVNSMFLAPFSEKEKSLSANDRNMIEHSTVGKIFMDCSEETANRFEKMALERGIKFKVTSLESFIGLWKEENEEMLKRYLFLSVVVSLCSVISMAATLSVGILLRKREYGIRVAFGSTKGRIMLTLCLEILVLGVISALLAFGLAYHSFSGNIIDSYREIYLRTLCETSVWWLAAVLLGLTAAVVMVPVRVIARQDPALLIKEEEG